jgi:hypothetical protein
MSYATNYSYGNRSTVYGNSCSYNNLMSYNNGIQGLKPAVPTSTVSGTYVVPGWNHVLSYDTLTKGNSCGGYASIVSAYGEGAQDCCPAYGAATCDTVSSCVPCVAAAAPPVCNPSASNPQVISRPTACGTRSR